MTTVTETTTLKALNKTIRWKALGLGMPRQDAIHAVVADVPAQDLGSLIMEANEEIHPFSVINGDFPYSQTTLEETLREMLRRILELQILMEAMRES